MNEIELTDLIINKHNLNPNKILKKPIRGLNGFNVYELIFAIITTNSLQEAATELGYTDNPIKQACREVLIPIFLYRSRSFNTSKTGSRSWKFELLNSIQYKYCSSCCEILPHSEFQNCKSYTDGLSIHCSVCRNIKSKEQKKYIRQRTPKWVNIELINNIYHNCPKGMHVDHIIPLRGVLVSGLHVPENLQYLTMEENLFKSNKFLL